MLFCIKTQRRVSKLQNETVLIIEDDLLAMNTYKKLLEDSGYDVECASSAKQALEILECREPMTIFLDLGLPDMPGLELLEKIKSGDRSSYAVNIITASDDSQTIIEALRLGANDFAIKPVERDKMKDIISRSRSYRQACLQNKDYQEAVDDSADLSLCKILNENPVLRFTPQENLKIITQAMRTYTIHVAAITDIEGNFYGVITERAVIKYLGTNEGDSRALASIQAHELVSIDIPVARKSATVQEIYKKMSAEGLDYLPVLEDQKFLGIVDYKTLVSKMFIHSQQKQKQSKDLINYMMGHENYGGIANDGF